VRDFCSLLSEEADHPPVCEDLEFILLVNKPDKLLTVDPLHGAKVGLLFTSISLDIWGGKVVP